MHLDHVHKYRRRNIGREKDYWVMQCGLPGCNHYMAGDSKLSFPNLKGKLCVCNICEAEFQLDRRALRMSLPVCVNCVKKKPTTVTEQEKANKFFENLLDSLETPSEK